MPDKDSLLDLLSDPGNIASAIEIANQIPEVKHRVHLAFWSAAERQLAQGLSKMATAQAWLIEGHDVVARRNGETWRGVHIVARLEDQNPRLLVGVWQENLRLFLGIAYDRPQPVPHPLREVEHLRERIRSDLASADAEHVGWKWTDIFLHPDEVIVQLAADPDFIANEAVEQVLAILDAHASDIAAADDALRRYSLRRTNQG